MPLREPSPSAPAGGPAPRPLRLTAEAVYRSSLRYVLGLLWYLGIPERDRDDVAQDVFLVVHRRLADYNPSLDLRAWLGGITWRTALRFQDLSRQHRELLGEADEPLDLVDDTAPDPEEQLAASQMDLELRRIVQAVIQTIPDEQRIVLIMHDLLGRGMLHIAWALDLPTGTAWDRLRRARLAFKAAVRRLAERDRRVLGLRGVAFPLLPVPLDAQGLLTRIPSLPEVPEGLEERLWSRLLRSPEIEHGGGGPTSGGPRSPEAPASASVAGQAGVARGMALAGGKLAAGALLTFLAGGAAGAALCFVFLHGDPTLAPADGRELPAAIEASAPPSAAPPGTEKPAASVAATASAASQPAPIARSAPAPKMATRGAAEEIGSEADLVLMKRVDAALTAGNAAAALTLLERHTQIYPRSPRAQRREVALIQALAMVGKTAEARARAERFRQAFPKSYFLPIIEQSVPPDPGQADAGGK